MLDRNDLYRLGGDAVTNNIGRDGCQFPNFGADVASLMRKIRETLDRGYEPRRESPCREGLELGDVSANSFEVSS